MWVELHIKYLGREMGEWGGHGRKGRGRRENEGRRKRRWRKKGETRRKRG